jgi:hypothetical protein
VAHLRQDEGDIEADCAIGTALGRIMSACIVNQDLPHQARSYDQKMGPVLSVKWPLVDNPQVSLVDQRRTLQKCAPGARAANGAAQYRAAAL